MVAGLNDSGSHVKCILASLPLGRTLPSAFVLLDDHTGLLSFVSVEHTALHFIRQKPLRNTCDDQAQRHSLWMMSCQCGRLTWTLFVEEVFTP